MLAACIWLYVLIKLLVFDFDIYLLQHFAVQWMWIIYCKFLILIGVIAAVWLFTNTSTIALWFAFILFYPVVLIFKLIWLLFKSRRWLLIIAVVNATMSIVQSFKYKYITLTISSIACVVILCTHNPAALVAAVVTLCAILIITFLRRFYYAFKPSPLYKMHSKLVAGLLSIWRNQSSPKDDTTTLPLEQMSPNQLQDWTNGLQTLVVANRFCCFLSSKLRQYQRSNITKVSDLLNVCVFTMISAVCFSFINYGLYKLIPHSFTITEQPHYFMFLYYSSTRLFGQAISEVVPVATISRCIAMLEMVAAMALVVIFISVCLPIKERLDMQEIDGAVAAIRRQGEEMEQFIQKAYKLSLSDAISELRRLKSIFLNVIVYLSDNTDVEGE